MMFSIPYAPTFGYCHARGTSNETLERQLSVPGASLTTLLFAVGIVACVYIGREVLLPMTLAILMSFVLAPLVDFLQRWYVPRIVAVIGVVLLAFAGVFSLGGLMISRVNQLASDLPRYQSTLRRARRRRRPRWQRSTIGVAPGATARSACWPPSTSSPARSMRWSRIAIAAANSSNSSSFSTTPIRPTWRSSWSSTTFRAQTDQSLARRSVRAPLRIHFHSQARLLAQSRRGFLFQTRPLRPAPHPRRIQAGTQGSLMAAVDYFNGDPVVHTWTLQGRQGRMI
jgi:hypothetical protein